jgi:outer membrane protein
MKNVSLILNVVLLIAVAVLFYLHFSSGKKTEQVKVASSNTAGTAPKGEVRIAYFEMDSINNAFQMVKDVRAELSKEEENLNNTLARMQKTYNDKFTQYQSQAKAGMSSIESDKANREMLQLQQRFSAEKQQMEQRLQDLSVRKMQEVKSKVEEFLKDYNKTRGYTYILAYEPGFMFYRDSSYDITGDVVKGLNEQYKKK